MNDKKISQICIIIIVIGILLFVTTYKNDFEEKSIDKVISENSTGLVFGRIDYVIKNSPTTQFILNDGNTILVFYPKETTLQKNDFVFVYAEASEYNTEKELFAHKVVKEK